MFHGRLASEQRFRGDAEREVSVKDSQKPDHVNLDNIVGRLREGRYVIPDFQRDFEWEPWDINELMRSIFRDYYIGSLLIWKGKKENFDALSCEAVYGFEGDESRIDIVLDGQQRLTAMYYAFMAPNKPAPKRRNRYLYFIKVDHFMYEAYDNAFEYIWTRRGPNLLNNRERQFQEHMFPLAVVGKGGWELANWVQEYEQYWKKTAESLDEPEAQTARLHASNAKLFGDHLREITGQYQISYIELDKDLELDKVCEIFTRINSRGVRLDIFDLLNALLRPKGIRLRQRLWREASSRLEFEAVGRMNVYVLQVMSILRQSYCSPKYLYSLIPGNPRNVRGPDGAIRAEVLISDATEFEKLWHEAVEALEQALRLLRHPQEFGVVSYQYLPYAAILPAFSTLQANAGQLPADQRLDAQRKVRLWYWASVFTNRYSGAVESMSARDYTDVSAWFTDDNLEPGVIREFRKGVRDLDLRRETRKGTSVYNGIFNMLVLSGARDWVSGTVPQHGDLDDHHIVPKSLSNEYGSITSIDTILNRAPLTAETNRDIIKDRLPNAYLSELIEKNGRAHVMTILRSHFISDRAFMILMKHPFTPDDYEDFIQEREQTFWNRIEQFASNEEVLPGL